jgi:DNA-binding transcriptional MerR regulator
VKSRSLLPSAAIFLSSDGRCDIRSGQLHSGEKISVAKQFSLPKTGGQAFTITEMAHQYDVTPRALRFYEDEGLLSPTRDGVARRYSPRDCIRLHWIIRGKELGFSLAEIRDMAGFYDQGGDATATHGITIERCRARIDLLTAQKADIDQRLDDLGMFVTALASGKRFYENS